jgi:hypothetical protein
MTRTPLAQALLSQPCTADPDLWDRCDSTEAQRVCRQLCPNRFTCAADALREPDMLHRLEGVIAGVAIPPQNKYGTSKARRFALKQLAAVAAAGQRINATETRRDNKPPSAGTSSLNSGSLRVRTEPASRAAPAARKTARRVGEVSLQTRVTLVPPDPQSPTQQGGVPH